jgi:GAF domain-containing protein
VQYGGSDFVDPPFSPDVGDQGRERLIAGLHTALQVVLLRSQLENTKHQLRRRIEELEYIYEAGIALSSQKDMQTLYHLILQISCRLTNADAGTLYIVEGSHHKPVLAFTASQTASLDAPYQHRVLPLTMRSIAGYVALTHQPVRVDDAHALPADAIYELDESFDRAFGYRTRSVLAVPMTNLESTVVGVIELINRKRNPEALLTSVEEVDREVRPFGSEDERIVSALASQAAVAVENRRLIETDRHYRALQEYVREVSKVIVAAAGIEAGTFESESLATVAAREDALGQLARTFQRMASEVQSRENRLREEIRRMRIEVDEAQKAREVTRITETDYFHKLKQNARDFRDET